jgi:hypothetical protein
MNTGTSGTETDTAGTGNTQGETASFGYEDVPAERRSPASARSFPASRANTT